MDRTIRGPWLHSALEELANDPDARNRDMARFSQPPPPYTLSCRSAATTEFEVPDFEEPQAPLTRSELRLKLDHERCASCPHHQFMDQWNDERREVENEINKSMLSGRLDPMYVGPDRGPGSLSYQRVKKRWVEQGIWRDNWSKIPEFDWKHEEPPESDSCSDSEIESETPPCAAPFSFSSNPSRLRPRPRPRPKKSDQEIQEAAERREIRRGIREKERNASRPFEQFLYQLRRESKRLEAGLTNTVTMNLDINALAFQNVQRAWVKRAIWDDEWRGFPGMSWKIERPLVMPPTRDHSPDHAQSVENQLEPRIIPTDGFGHMDAHVSPSQEMRTPLESCIAGTIEPQISSAAAPSHARTIESIGNEEHYAVDNHIEHDSSRIRDKSSPSLPSNPAAAVPPQRSNVDQNAATGLASNNIALLSETELAMVEKDPASSPPRRSKRLQDKAKKPVMPSSGQTVKKPLRQTRRKPAGASKTQGISKRSAPSKPRKQAKKN